MTLGTPSAAWVPLVLRWVEHEELTLAQAGERYAAWRGYTAPIPADRMAVFYAVARASRAAREWFPWETYLL